MDGNRIQQMKELIDFARNEGLKSLSYEDENLAVSFEFALGETQACSLDSGSAGTKKHQSETDAKLIYIDSPLDGKFYRSPSPDSAPYAEIGTSVHDGDTICIVEAMKVMNEIIAECNGKVVKILCENGDDVRAGQHLFAISAS